MGYGAVTRAMRQALAAALGASLGDDEEGRAGAAEKS